MTTTNNTDLKNKVINAGFEVRTGHIILVDSRGESWMSQNARDYAFLLVHKNRPQIKEILERSYGPQYITKGSGDRFKDEWVLSYAASEEELWEDVFEYVTDELIKDALKN